LEKAATGEKASSRTSCDARAAPVSALRACRCLVVLGRAPDDGFEVAHHDRQQVVEIMRDAAGAASLIPLDARKQQFDLFEDLVGNARPRCLANVRSAEGGDEPLWLLVEGRTRDRKDKSV
jgi:hypothetical protein